MNLASTAPGLITGTAGYRRISEIFGEIGTVDAYLRFERALAESQAALGIIPGRASADILACCNLDNLDLGRLREDAARVGYPIVSLIEQLAEAAGDSGQWVHYGATTQDVMDTALVLQSVEAGRVIIGVLDNVCAQLADIAQAHRSTLMAGRSKLQHAAPVTFGYRAAVWLDQVDRQRHRLASDLDDLALVQLGGAVGTLSAYGAHGLELRAEIARRLGLGEADITWHVSRDRVAQVGHTLASTIASLAKIATDVTLLMSTEVNELREPFVEGRGSSSAMPQKRNPVISEAIIEAARDMHSTPGRMLDAMLQDHERSIGHGYGERRALASAFADAAGAAHLAGELLAGLEVDADRMRRNLDNAEGHILAEAAVLALAPLIGRLEAHHEVQEACREATAMDMPLAALLKERRGIRIEDLVSNLRLDAQTQMIDRIIDRSRRTRGSIK